MGRIWIGDGGNPSIFKSVDGGPQVAQTVRIVDNIGYLIPARSRSPTSGTSTGAYRSRSPSGRGQGQRGRSRFWQGQTSITIQGNGAGVNVDGILTSTVTIHNERTMKKGPNNERNRAWKAAKKQRQMGLVQASSKPTGHETVESGREEPQQDQGVLTVPDSHKATLEQHSTDDQMEKYEMRSGAP